MKDVRNSCERRQSHVEETRCKGTSDFHWFKPLTPEPSALLRYAMRKIN